MITAFPRRFERVYGVLSGVERLKSGALNPFLGELISNFDKLLEGTLLNIIQNKPKIKTKIDTKISRLDLFEFMMFPKNEWEQV
jgi:hypothetical protein